MLKAARPLMAAGAVRPDRDPPGARRSSASRYVVVGALARVIHGSDELTDGLDIVPATAGREPAPARARARPTSTPAARTARPLAPDRDLAASRVLELRPTRAS